MDIVEETRQLMAYYHEIEPVLIPLRKAITDYYRVKGEKLLQCGVSISTHPPGIGMDFVPESARPRLAELIREAGLELHMQDGAKGQQAYFVFSRSSITEDKLMALKAAVEAETALELQQPSQWTERPKTPPQRGL